jgi:HPt (histidine-containing phosphotransfer) domain-containing protein
MERTWVETIAEIETQMGSPAVARLARIFLDDSKTQLQAIAAAIAAEDLAEAREAAHKLAARAQALHFRQLHQVLIEFDGACGAADGPMARKLQKQLPPLVAICALQLRTRYKLA